MQIVTVPKKWLKKKSGQKSINALLEAGVSLQVRKS